MSYLILYISERTCRSQREVISCWGAAAKVSLTNQYFPISRFILRLDTECHRLPSLNFLLFLKGKLASNQFLKNHKTSPCQSSQAWFQELDFVRERKQNMKSLKLLYKRAYHVRMYYSRHVWAKLQSFTLVLIWTKQNEAGQWKCMNSSAGLPFQHFFHAFKSRS